jgi:hypothetical protein
MSRKLYPETAYSFRRIPTVALDDAAVIPRGVLLRIHRLLVAAGQAFRTRRFTDAIDDYTEVRRLLWSQLYPLARFDELATRDVDLYRTLVSYSAEWMNVLPVEAPVEGVRPREIAQIETGQVLGLRAKTANVEVTYAAADLSTARSLERVGNAASARFFRDRAEATAPAFVDAESSVERISVSAREEASVRSDGDDGSDLRRVDLPMALAGGSRSYALQVDGKVNVIRWDAGEAPSTDDLLSKVFEPRKYLKLLPDRMIAPERPADGAAALPHVWYYETLLGLAECHHALGNFTAAEDWYVQAAGYRYLNAAVEAPYVWCRLATLYLDWGNSLFRRGDTQAALDTYGKVIDASGAVPASRLYTIAGLAPAAEVAKKVIAALSAPETVSASPAMVAVIFDVWAQLVKLAGGLDYWGHWGANVPVWTFDYLQSVAANFCQLAIGAERDAIAFWEKADQGALTRTQLEQNVALAQSEKAAADAQVAAADAMSTAYVFGELAAQQRANNATNNAAEYANLSDQWIMHQALAAQLGAGAHADPAELNRVADRMLSGSYRYPESKSVATELAAEQLTASRLQRQYEIDSMRRQQIDLQAAANQAAAERAAAQARAAAARASATAAGVRVDGALELVDAFDQQRFTPDVWNKLGERMNALSRRYLAMALDVAKLMQRAYNFENDTTRALIKPDYEVDTVKELLAADALMADIQSFTYDLVTSTAPPPQPVRQTISLAQRYPFLFERDLRTTGRMEFETRIDDFDLVYPGSYAGRIEYVEVDVDGIVPARGISGTLTNAGISHYRVPSAAWTTGNGLKHRIQNRETLIISDHDPRLDAILTDPDRRRRRVFEGAGVASSWTLELPRNVNDLDYDAITDVRLTFSYEARYDRALHDRVLAELAALPALDERQRPLPLRWLFPDAFFSFYDTGVLTFELDPLWFPRSELDPKMLSLGLLAVTTPSSRRDGIVLKVKAPGTAEAKVTTAADGTVDAADLAGVAGKPATGEFRIALDAADNPTWVSAHGTLELDPTDNLALILGYSFNPRL